MEMNVVEVSGQRHSRLGHHQTVRQGSEQRTAAGAIFISPLAVARPCSRHRRSEGSRSVRRLGSRIADFIQKRSRSTRRGPSCLQSRSKPGRLFSKRSLCEPCIQGTAGLRRRRSKTSIKRLPMPRKCSTSGAKPAPRFSIKRARTVNRQCGCFRNRLG